MLDTWAPPRTSCGTVLKKFNLYQQLLIAEISSSWQQLHDCHIRIGHRARAYSDCWSADFDTARQAGCTRGTTKWLLDDDRPPIWRSTHKNHLLTCITGAIEQEATRTLSWKLSNIGWYLHTCTWYYGYGKQSTLGYATIPSDAQNEPAPWLQKHHAISLIASSKDRYGQWNTILGTRRFCQCKTAGRR